jgi:lysine/ornithine N-monooxygenase
MCINFLNMFVRHEVTVSFRKEGLSKLFQRDPVSQHHGQTDPGLSLLAMRMGNLRLRSNSKTKTVLSHETTSNFFKRSIVFLKETQVIDRGLLQV